jgi:DNA polymerase III epsilon subunit-like protein
MKKLLFIDTETSDLANFELHARDSRQPHIAAASGIITNETNAELERFEAIAKETTWTSQPGARETHGITRERSLAEGIDEKIIVETILAMIKRVDLIVAFNSTFDKFVVRCAARRFGMFTDADDVSWKALNVFCTMRPMTNICCIPKKSGSGFKFPKLAEAYKHAFGKELEKAHQAAPDNEANRELYFWIQAHQPKGE